MGVANGQIDLAIVGGEVPNELEESLEITSYAEDELALILPVSHPFSSLKYIQKKISIDCVLLHWIPNLRYGML